MSNLRPSIEYLAKEFNKVQNNRDSIIFAVESEKQIKEKVKEMEEKTKADIDKTSPNFEFNPKEIQPIVLNNRNKDER